MKKRILVLFFSFLVGMWSHSNAQSLFNEGFGKGYILKEFDIRENSVPLLSSFYFLFVAEGKFVDHHINSIMVFPSGVAEDMSSNVAMPQVSIENGKIGLAYTDWNKDDEYFYKVAYYPISDRSVKRYQIRRIGCAGSCEHPLSPPPGQGYVFVLVGLKIYFHGNRDHHVNEIAVYEDNRNLIIKLNDKKVEIEDTFHYVVDYAWVSLRLIKQQGEANGSARGGERVNLPKGAKVIRGFSFDFKSKDHHLRDIGVVTYNEKLEVYYGDENMDDEFNWNVRWAIIRPALMKQPIKIKQPVK